MKPSNIKLCVDVPLENKKLEEIVDVAKDFALINGISLHSNACFDRNCVRISKFTLIPTSFPRDEFNKAKNIQVTINKLMHKVAYDDEFLTKTLQSTIEADDFTMELFKLYKIIYNTGYAQNNSLGLFRSDYLLNGDLNIKQIECNTISSSFAGLAPVVSKLHKYILSQLGHADKIKNIPDNNSAAGFASGLTEAWKIYNNKESVILFVVEEITYNICDQRVIEHAIHDINPQIKVIRRTFNQLINQAQLRANKELFVEDYLVAVVYYRTGYESSAYTSQEVWKVRLLMERSRAIKCPSIQYHLAGTKKVQQALAQPDALKRFLSENEIILVRQVFAGLYSLDFDENGDRAAEMAILHPEKYVMKPQREGGGNNIYGLDVKTTLESIKNSKVRTGYILMEYIDAPRQKNYLLGPNNEDICLQELISELGIYGIIIGDQNNIKLNKEVGHVLRTKPFGEDEGGIIAGAGGLDSPYLVE
ncbi:glutathione synthetase [Microplitis demolitor]|uniref:glutathione synthetase n=1 Tax=Microplitis demolitor TaxID=69319 RepID=UPI0004CD80B0|nr:glutathione synthetase [Microplitis demolitor]XP_014300474.1 glutathione synthetase [Microplitis demolitor]XP_053594128.1 glutathione synthetase [Microplitis demolitor]